MSSLFICRKIIICLALLISINACQAKEALEIEMPSGKREAFFVDYALTDAQHAKGLMFVETMPENAGMLFVFPKPRRTQFWMRNTLIPLDMLFFDTNNTLVHIVHSATPHDLRPQGPNKDNICSVLELNGGTAEKLGIAEGSKLLSNSTQQCLQSSIK